MYSGNLWVMHTVCDACPIVHGSSVCVECVRCDSMCVCRKRNEDIWPVNLIWGRSERGEGLRVVLNCSRHSLKHPNEQMNLMFYIFTPWDSPLWLINQTFILTMVDLTFINWKWKYASLYRFIITSLPAVISILKPQVTKHKTRQLLHTWEWMRGGRRTQNSSSSHKHLHGAPGSSLCLSNRYWSWKREKQMTNTF